VSDIRLVLRPEARVGAFVARRFAPFVVTSLARVDALSDVHYLTADDLRALGSTADEAFEHARARVEAPGSTVVRAACASGLLAVPGWLASFEPRGRTIASVPDRDVVLVSFDASPAAVVRFADDATRAFHDAERPLSPALYTVDDRGEVVPFTDAEGVALGHALLASSAYTEQKTRLDATARHGASFVAEHLLVEHRDDGHPVTIATWGERTSTLLPRTDVVVLAGPSWRFAVRWPVLEARVARTCWTLRDDLRPARIMTTAWPSEADLDALFDARDPLVEGSRAVA
jgi:hypothetical protein